MAQLKLSNNTAKLHQMFGKRLYKDEYAFISEICQNAVDSHRMSGQKDPVTVGLKKESRGFVFYVRDTGLSFDSKEDFIEKIGTLLESGKSEEKTDSEDCAMGMHGIGSISVSAFQSEWRYTIVKNGRKFTATLKEIEGMGLNYELSNYSKTEEEKYVLFEVVVPSTKSIYQVIKSMKEKLCYFKDIMFEFDEYLMSYERGLLTLNTEFKIFQSDDFQISTLSPSSQMHICLDQYSYPINWEKLGIDPIYMNIGLKFSLADGLEPDITREGLIYNPDYAKIIKDKIKKVATWFIDRYNSGMPDELTSVKMYFTAIQASKAVLINSTTYIINPLIQHSANKIKDIIFKGVDQHTLNRYTVHTRNGQSLYKYSGEITQSGKKAPRAYYAFKQEKMILVDKPMSTRMNAYIRSDMRGAGLYTKSKMSLKQYRSVLGLHWGNRSKWRVVIKQMQELEKSYEKDYFVKVSNIVIPETFSTGERKKAVRKDKVSLEDMSGEVGIKYAKPMDKFSYTWNCKFVEKVVKVKDLHKQPFLHVYTTEENRKSLDSLYSMCRTGYNKIAPCIISNRQQAYIKKLKLHNFMTIEDFFKGKHRLFRSVITAYLIDRLIKENNHVFSNKELISSYLSSKFAGDLEKLMAFRTKYSSNMIGVPPLFMQELVTMAQEGKLYDYSIWTEYTRVKEDISKFNFVRYFADYKFGGNQKEALEVMHDVAKYRSIKMDWKYYSMDFDK